MDLLQRSLAPALSVLFWSRLGNAVFATSTDLTLKLLHQAVRRQFINNEFVLAPIWTARQWIGQTLELAGIGALIVLARRLPRAGPRSELRATVGLAIIAVSADFLRHFDSFRSQNFLALEHLLGIGALTMLTLTGRSVRLLASSPRGPASPVARWHMAELFALAFLLLVWPLFIFLLEIFREATVPTELVSSILYVPIAMRALLEALVLAVLRVARRTLGDGTGGSVRPVADR